MRILKHSGALFVAALTLSLTTACAGQSVSPTPILLATATNGPQIVTKPPVTPNNTATPLPATVTPVVPTSTIGSPIQIGTPPATLTLGPQITSSGPTVAPKVSNAQTFNKSSPATIGAFRRVNEKGNVASEHGSVLTYATAEGAEYQVSLWITDSAQDALERYRVEVGSLPDKRPLKLGDEAVITGPSSYVLAEVRYRNIVLVIYRPNPKVGTIQARQPTENEVIVFVTALFKSIPQS